MIECQVCTLENWTYHPAGIIKCMNCGHEIQLEIRPLDRHEPRDNGERREEARGPQTRGHNSGARPQGLSSGHNRFPRKLRRAPT